MAAAGSMALVAVSLRRLAAVWMAVGSELAAGSAIGDRGRCAADAAWATTPPVRASAITTPSTPPTAPQTAPTPPSQPAATALAPRPAPRGAHQRDRPALDRPRSSPSPRTGTATA